MLGRIVVILVYLTVISSVMEAFAGEDGTGRLMKWLVSLVRLAAVAAAAAEVLL